MVVALSESGLLAGAASGLAQQWPRLPKQEIYDSVADAVASLYDAIRAGKDVRHPQAWIKKVAWRAAAARHERMTSERALGDTKLVVPSPDASIAELPDERRRLLFGKLRALLPQLGPSQRQAIEVVLDMVEAGYEHVDGTDVADRTGLEQGNAAVALSRGRRSLLRLAKEGALVGAHLAFLDTEPESQSDTDVPGSAGKEP